MAGAYSRSLLMGTEHWAETAVQLNFTLAIVFLGVGTIIGGLWQDKVGPRKVAATAGIIYGIGYMLSGFAASHHSLNGLYVGYGVLTGIGMGLLAWGLAAIPSPIMIAHIHQDIGKYAPAINVITIVMICSLVFPLIARRPSGERTGVQVAATSR
jgi:MFS family permease